MNGFVHVDTMSGAARYVSREFGDYGYSIRVVSSGMGRQSLFELCHSDGSRRLFLLDPYDNVELAPDGLTSDDDWSEWCRNAADRLYVRRNGYCPPLPETAVPAEYL